MSAKLVKWKWLVSLHWVSMGYSNINCMNNHKLTVTGLKCIGLSYIMSRIHLAFLMPVLYIQQGFPHQTSIFYTGLSLRAVSRNTCYSWVWLMCPCKSELACCWYDSPKKQHVVFYVLLLFWVVFVFVLLISWLNSCNHPEPHHITVSIKILLWWWK